MKSTLSKIIISVVIVGSFASCGEFLDLKPVSDYNTSTFYKTQGDFELAVNGIYAEVQALSDNNIPLALESRSDNVRTTGGYDTGVISKFIDDGTVPILENIYTGFWRTIDRSNAVLDRIGGVPFEDTKLKEQLTGEAYFLRGYAYFQLAWMYGGMPLIDRQTAIEKIRQTPRSTQEQTLDLAREDLQKAADLLPEVYPAKYSGKATRYAAKGILARLYLFERNHAAAKPLLEEIINSGKYEMFAKYADSFADQYDNGKEHVFQIQYNSGLVGEGNELVYTLAPENIRSSLFPQGGRSISLPVSIDLYESYEPNDIRRDFTIQSGHISNTGAENRGSLFYIKFAHGSIPPDKTDYEVNVPVLRYTDVRLMYAEILNEEGYTAGGEAFQILNDVRKRAGLPPLTTQEVPDQAAFRDQLFKERRVEFAGEFLRWFDLVRSGRALATMNAFLKRPDEGGGRYVMKDYQAIFAIPNNELNINPNRDVMYQNPGY